MAKSKGQTSKVHILLKLFAVFFITYLFVATLIWGAQRIHYYHGVVSGLSTFAAKEHASLVNNIFDTAITKAKMCVSLPEEEKLQCQDEVRIFIATELKEESLLDWRVMSDSLHFIKREGDTLYTLNWEGKLAVSQVGDRYTHVVVPSFMDLSHDEQYKDYEVKLPPSNNNPMRYFNLFFDRCKYFDLFDYNSCQATVTVPLDQDTDGYLVSMMVLTEESMWWLYSLILPVAFIQHFITSPFGLFSESMPFALLSFSIIATPALITYLYWKRYLKNK